MNKLLITSVLAALALCLAPAAHADGCGNNNNNLQCDAGGPYQADATPGPVTVHLDGTGSNHATSWHWTTSYPGAVFDNANSSTPNLTITVGNDCSFNVNVQLTVSDGQHSRTCSAHVRFRDRTPPVLTCPPNAKLICGGDLSPCALGYATATDNCDQHVHVTYHDHVITGDCPADRFDKMIERRWRAVDDDCNVATCTQIIDVVKVAAFADILPGVCPNDYQRNSCDLLPIAILGTEGFDVTHIQWNTVRLWLEGCDAGPVEPHNLCLADVGTPFVGGAACDCHNLNGDGRLDLVARFNRHQVNERLHLGNVPVGTVIRLVVSGRLCDGCKFVADDCIVVR